MERKELNQSQSPIPPPASDLGQEPFPCPHCGQMLAPSCRVCVACRQAVEPPAIGSPRAAPVLAEVVEERLATPPPERVSFPWVIFLLVVAIWMAGATSVQLLLPPFQSQLLLAGVQVLTAVWVLFDAGQRGVPKPLRWSLGTLLLWPVIFPWYLSRRRKPQARCPFVEGAVGRLTRALIVVLLLVLIVFVLKSPPGK